MKTQAPLLSKARRLICPLAISLLSLSISLAPDAVSEQLQYHRVAIAAGEWWRLLSAHLTHLGWGHLLMNLAGLWLIWNLFPSRQHPNGCFYTLPLLMTGTSLGLWFFSSEVIWYQGLSGALHGLLIVALLQNIKTETMLSISLLLAVIAKLAWEQWQGALPGSESVASGRVIVDAHLYGALSGGILWGIERLGLNLKSAVMK